MTAEFGDDPWPYGIEPNRVTIEWFLERAYEQGVWRDEAGARGPLPARGPGPLQGLEDRLQVVGSSEGLFQRVRRVDLRRVPLDEAALEHEVPDGVNLLGLDDGQHHVIRAEGPQRQDLDAKLLGELRDLRGAFPHHLPGLGVGRRAQLRWMLGDYGERRHDVPPR